MSHFRGSQNAERAGKRGWRTQFQQLKALGSSENSAVGGLGVPGGSGRWWPTGAGAVTWAQVLGVPLLELTLFVGVSFSRHTQIVCLCCGRGVVLRGTVGEGLGNALGGHLGDLAHIKRPNNGRHARNARDVFQIPKRYHSIKRGGGGGNCSLQERVHFGINYQKKGPPLRLCIRQCPFTSDPNFGTPAGDFGNGQGAPQNQSAQLSENVWVNAWDHLTCPLTKANEARVG